MPKAASSLARDCVSVEPDQAYVAGATRPAPEQPATLSFMLLKNILFWGSIALSGSGVYLGISLIAG